MEFLRTSGVVYNALMTKRYKSDSSLDVSTFDIESWIRRDSHFLPTWGNLLMILRNMGFKREATHIERYLKEMPQKQGSEVEIGKSLHNVVHYSACITLNNQLTIALDSLFRSDLHRLKLENILNSLTLNCSYLCICPFTRKTTLKIKYYCVGH